MGRGGVFRFGKTLLCGSVFFSSIFFARPLAYAATPLSLPRDVVGSTVPTADHVVHVVSFVLPQNAQQIYPNDYIIIELPNFNNVTEPNGYFGVYGTPTITNTNNSLTMTNVAVIPGASVEIAGFSASNPGANQSNVVKIIIAQDSAGTIIQNESDIAPTLSNTPTTVSATVRTQTATLSLNGFTAAGAFVTLGEDNNVLSTTSADSSGYFSFFLTGLSPGSHVYTLISTDSGGLTTSVTTLNLYLLTATVTSATNILLSPTITENKASIAPGDTITFNGSGKPSSQVNLFTQAPLRSYTVTTDANGNWSYTLPSTETTQYTPGVYQIYGIVQDSSGNQSAIGPTVNFTVTVAQSNNPPPNCDISHGDLNCDGKTNLTDFSILLFYWTTNQRRADINKDGLVNLTDFSIMMYYYQS